MIQLSLNNDESSLYYDVILTHQKLENLQIFSSDIDDSSKLNIRDVIYL